MASKKQWIKSWKVRGTGNTPDKRIVLYMDGYDYIFSFESLTPEKKYNQDCEFKVPSSGDNIIKLTHGLLFKAQTLKSKTFVQKDKAPAPVLIDYSMSVFTQDSKIDMLRIFSVNKQVEGKTVRRTFICVYKFDSYDAFKDVMYKNVSSTELRTIPEAYRKGMIELSIMPITNGTFVSADTAMIDDIASTVATCEAAKHMHTVSKYITNIGEEENKEEKTYNSSESTSSSNTHDDTDFKPANATEAAPIEDDEFPF